MDLCQLKSKVLFTNHCIDHPGDLWGSLLSFWLYSLYMDGSDIITRLILYIHTLYYVTCSARWPFVHDQNCTISRLIVRAGSWNGVQRLHDCFFRYFQKCKKHSSCIILWCLCNVRYISPPSAIWVRSENISLFLVRIIWNTKWRPFCSSWLVKETFKTSWISHPSLKSR